MTPPVRCRFHRRQLGDDCGYSKLANDLFDVPLPREFGPTSRHIFCALNRVANERPNREWSVSQGELAAMCGVGKKTVGRALGYLTRVKLVTVVSPGGVRRDGQRLTAVYRVATSMAEANFDGHGATATPEEFARFWALYPRNQAKGEALKAWREINPTPELATAICDAVIRQQPQWARVEPMYIPNPASWLRGERWEDEVDDAATSRSVSSGSVLPRRRDEWAKESAGEVVL